MTTLHVLPQVLYPECRRYSAKCTQAECKMSLPVEGCAIAVANAYPEGVTLVVAGDLLGVSRQRVLDDERRALRKLSHNAAAKALRREAGGGDAAGWVLPDHGDVTDWEDE